MKLATRKIFIATLSVTALLTAACHRGRGNNEDPNKTNISIYSFNGGVGNEWLNQAIRDFSELKSEYSYESGRTGVNITWYGNTYSDGELANMKTSSVAMYFTEKGQTPYDLSNLGYAYDLTDLVHQRASEEETVTIEEKIDEGYRTALQGQDGHYYALPHYEWYPGLTYDVTAFDNDGFEPFYFAAPDEEDAITFEAEKRVGSKTYNFGTGRFIATSEGKKSCGNDGLYGTEDDGLPSSVEEFLILCTYLSSKNIAPLAVAGNHRDYSAYLLQGFLTSLLGNEGIQRFYDFDGTINLINQQNNGKFITDGELFCAGSGIPNPTYTPTVVTERTGYQTRETYERYYLAALMKIMLQCNFFTDKSINSGATNLQTQKGFINETAKYKSAMLIEGNYWYNEAEAEGYFDAWSKNHHGEERNLGWMSLPSKLTGSVEPNEDEDFTGYKTPLLDTGYSYCIVNKYALNRKSEGYRNAVLDFVKFLYSERQLQQFTKITGVCKAALNYQFYSDDVVENLSTFQKQVMALKKNNGVVYTNIANDTFRKHQADFRFGIEAPIWQTTIGNVTYKEYITAFKDPDHPNNTVEAVVKGSFISPSVWERSYYEGE